MPEAAFLAQQRAFAAHLRAPDQHAAPAGVEDRRMQIYRDLFYRNIEGFIARAFPVLRKLIADEPWHAMVRDFFHRHRCETPYFIRIPEEFLQYLQEERQAHADDPPFMLELAHYEWVEIALDVADVDLDGISCDVGGDLLVGCPLVSPLAWPLSYQYAVHRIGPDWQPDAQEQEPVWLIVWRNRADEIRFMESNAVTVRMLQLLGGDAAITGQTVLEQIAAEMQHPNPAVVIENGARTLMELRDKEILLGTSPPEDPA